MRSSHNNHPSIFDVEMSINPRAIIPLIEHAIKLESVTMEANRILDNEIDYLTSNYRITQAKLLLSVLRRKGSI